MKEAMEKAEQCMDMALDDLREAYNKANPVEGLLISEMIELGRALAQKMVKFNFAVGQKDAL